MEDFQKWQKGYKDKMMAKKMAIGIYFVPVGTNTYCIEQNMTFINGSEPCVFLQEHMRNYKSAPCKTHY